MSFLAHFTKSVQQGAKTFQKEAEKFVAHRKIDVEISSLTSQKNSLYRQMGEMAFASWKDGKINLEPSLTDELERLCVKIRELNEKINDKEKEKLKKVTLTDDDL